MRLPEEQKKDELHPQDRAAQDLPAALRGWLDDATGQMRWKRARPVAARELADHLTDQYEVFLDEGMDEDEAAQATAREMGDAVETGTLLDRAWRPRPDWVMLGIVLAVAAVGLGLQYIWNPELGAGALLGRYAAGAVCLLAAYFIDYTVLTKRLWLLLAIWAAAIVLMDRLGSVQPDALIWLFPLLLAGLICRMGAKGTEGLANCLMAVVGLYLLLWVMHYVSLNGIILALCSAVLLAAVCHRAFGRVRVCNVLLALLPGAFALLRYLMSTLFVRSLGVSKAQNASLMTQLIRYMLFGTEPYYHDGAFATPTETFWESVNAQDNLLTIIQLEWGWLAMILVLVPLAVLLGRGLVLAGRQRGQLAWLTGHAVVLTLGIQVVWYLLVNLGISDSAGTYGLPLIAADGMYICQTMFLLGLLLSAQRSGGLESGPAPCPAAGQAETMDRE